MSVAHILNKQQHTFTPTTHPTGERRNISPLLLELAQALLSILVALAGRFPVPEHRLTPILGSTNPMLVANPHEEMSLGDIAELRQKLASSIELEAFIHGAMCVAYSGRCIISSYLTGRSGNRGLCAQPCRLPFEPTRENPRPCPADKAALSLKDNCLVEYIRDRIGGREDLEMDRVFVTHSGIPEEQVKLAVDQVRELQPFREILITRAGCTVSSHCGPGTIGVLFVRK